MQDGISLDRLMALVREGKLVVVLVDGRLYWRAKPYDAAVAQAVLSHRATLTKLLRYSCTRLCTNTIDHAPRYQKQESGWYSCPDCHRSRAELAERHKQAQAARKARMAQEAIV